ncbi:MAG: bifunctional adenosylcobinamide kinase/adenosylcobinamide-phosphate guanylyltransferase [Chloroflexota bacterium]|nr:bifunctional adenosylcobinamide kinase/adenosylcobinamide-phosphate guanylyltransferase [Chloroflexota bacterium]
MAATLTLVLGGVRSGKSAYAETLAEQSGRSVLYVATGQAIDDEMAQRIRQHRERRPDYWSTVEEPVDLAKAVEGALLQPRLPEVALLDSLDVWVSNLLLAHDEDDAGKVEQLALGQLEALVQVLDRAGIPAVMVSSEVGLGPVPPNRLGRRFQDLLGTVNQRAAQLADSVWLVVAGISVQIKPH